MTTATTSTVTTSEGHRLAVQSLGDAAKPTVVLVHGFPDDHTAWDGIVERLAADHRVVTYDTRGAGGSDKPRHIADYRLDLLADDLQRVVDHAIEQSDTGRGVHLVGHDWGSVQAWHLVTEPAHRGVRSFTSISGPCIDHVPAGSPARPRRAASATSSRCGSRRSTWASSRSRSSLPCSRASA